MDVASLSFTESHTMPFDGKEGVAIELETNKIGILCALESGASTTNVRL